MRIPEGRLHRTAIHMVGEARTRIDELQRQIATGKRLTRVSDDPASAVGAQALRTLLAENGVHQRNIADARQWNGATELAVQSILELLMQIEEAALRGRDDAAEERKTLGNVVDDLLAELVAQANSKLGDRQLFGGFDSRTETYSTTNHVSGEMFSAAPPGTAADLANARLVTGTVVVTNLAGTRTYVEGADYRVEPETGRIVTLAGGGLVGGQAYRAEYDTETVSAVVAQGGDAGEIARRIGRDRLVPVNLTADEVFGSNGTLFRLVIDLKNALWKDDGPRIGALLVSLEVTLERVGGLEGVLGGRAETLDRQEMLLASDELALHDHLSLLEGADVAAAVVHLQSQQNAYEAALAVTARLFQIGLVHSL